MKLRIYIGKDKALQAEALDCLMALGYAWRGESCYLQQASFDAIYTGMNTSDGIICDQFISLDNYKQLRSDFKEVSIEDLRDMVVLHRKDVSDATHEDGNNKFYDASGKTLYHFFDGTWIECSPLVSMSPTFKRIQKLQEPQPAPEPAPLQEEYLNTKTGELLLWGKGQPRSTNWIKVPEGADCAFLYDKDTELEVVEFYKENCRCFFSNSKQEWMRLTGSLPHQKNVCVKIWQRDIKPNEQIRLPDTLSEAPSLNDIAKTAEEHRQEVYRAVLRDPSNPHSDYVVDPEPSITNEINDLCDQFGCLPGMDRLTWLREQLQKAAIKEQLYQYSASINTPRGTVHYDGLIAFPGRITSIEDYQKVRAEIAQDGNTTPDKVNVHSLNIVG